MPPKRRKPPKFAPSLVGRRRGEGAKTVIVAIHQPQYLPWIGYIHKLVTADAFCFLDNVQYKKNEWQNRNRIKTAEGWQWLTVPVRYRFPQQIDDVAIDNNTPWQKKHRHALHTNYRRSAFFDEVWAALAEGFHRRWQRLADVNIFFVERICDYLGLGAKLRVRASRMTLRDDPTDRLIDICKSLGAGTYLSGPDGAGYMDLERFRSAGIQVVFQDFVPPAYPQQFNGFEPRLSIVDMLFNCGPRTAELLSSPRAAPE